MLIKILNTISKLTFFFSLFKFLFSFFCFFCGASYRRDDPKKRATATPVANRSYGTSRDSLVPPPFILSPLSFPPLHPLTYFSPQDWSPTSNPVLPEPFFCTGTHRSGPGVGLLGCDLNSQRLSEISLEFQLRSLQESGWVSVIETSSFNDVQVHRSTIGSNNFP